MSKPYETTLPALLLDRARKHPKKIAMREKEWGVWQPFTWQQYFDATAEFAAGLDSLGIGPGDIIILIGDNRPEWLWAELAIQALGGMALGLYQDSTADEVEYIFSLTEAKMVVAEDQEQVDKVLELMPNLTQLKHIVYHNPKGLAGAEDAIAGLKSFDKVRELGRATAGEFETWVSKVTPDDA
ncbi:MAG: AMP-binding protein, partial [Proteobacteria bacterium]|nr:AMP-binding protein [Pseudomonadota bacterium]